MLRPQAKHERNFMSELLDEFLASLEKFGELTDLGVEDRAGTNIVVCLGSAR